MVASAAVSPGVSVRTHLSIAVGAVLLVAVSACRDKDSGVLVEPDTDVEVGTDTDLGTDTDADTQPPCGNGVVDTGELCDVAIADGQAGACPGDCADDDACTTEVLSGTACMAECVTGAVETCTDDDGCCADGCTSLDDNDCDPECGNGVVEDDEVCDGDCPTTCADQDACTTDTLAGDPLDCDVTCESVAIVTCVDGDGCCAPGCDNTEDSDCEAGCDPESDVCEPECGNGIVEGDEDCDDGNTDANDTCDDCAFADALYRVTDLDLRDPHVFADLPFVGCTDVTDQPFGQDGVNPLVQASIEEDDNNDGMLDLSLLLTFPERLPSATMGPVELTDADCTAPEDSTACTAQPSASVTEWTYVQQTSGTCVSAVSGTTRASYVPSLAMPEGPCFATDTTTVVVNTGLVSFTLAETQLGAADVSSLPAAYTDGLLRGFLTQTEAQAVVFPSDTPFIGGDTLASVLRGHASNCSPDSDMDVHPTLGDGWWMYFNFTASRVPGP